MVCHTSLVKLMLVEPMFLAIHSSGYFWQKSRQPNGPDKVPCGIADVEMVGSDKAPARDGMMDKAKKTEIRTKLKFNLVFMGTL